MNFFEAVDIYIENRGLEKAFATMKGELIDLRLLCLYLKNPVFSKVTDEQIVQYLRTLIQYGWTQNGVYKKAIVFRSFWKYCNQKAWETFNYNLIPVLKVDATMPKVATEDMYRKVLAVIPERPYYHVRNKAMIMMLKHTGMRCGELASMQMDENFNLERQSAVIRTEKSRGQKPFRQVFWYEESGEVKKALNDWLEVRTRFAKEGEFDDPMSLFVGFSTMGYGKQLKAHSISIALRKYSLMAKVSPCLNPHSLRHLFAHDIVKAGGSNSDVMNLLGHAKMESSRVYTLMHGEELHERYLKLRVKKNYSE